MNKPLPPYAVPERSHSVSLMHSTLRSRAALVGAFAFFAVALAGCGAPSATDTGSDTETGPDTEQSDGGSFEGVTLSGDGSYSIPDQMPYGGYQLEGEPDEQPAGCTWSIQDADGDISFENTGQYVFVTDIPEAVTFVTAGCPDWQQFE